MKVSFVVPRYGVEVVGGAEYAARMLAERLVSQKGFDVDVVTTCALDIRTWADEYAPGEVEINGVRVRRFRSTAGRADHFDAWSALVLPDKFLSVADQEEWFRRQGPVNDDMVDAAVATDADIVVFYPYLYYPTVIGLPKIGRRAVMHPAAHDEGPLRLRILGGVFHAAGGLVFQTWSERRLVEGLFRVAATPQIVLGLGVEEAAGDAAAARQALRIGEAPYLLCVGRVDDGKGARALAGFFAAYKERRPGPLKLVFAGPVVHAPGAHRDVVVAGVVDESTKWGLLRGSLALVNPSAFEAFSLVVMEGWTAGVPVVVNGRCEATREHCERSGGGLWYESYRQFEVVVDRLSSDAALRLELAERGRAYVDREFRWSAIIERYAAFLTACAARA